MGTPAVCDHLVRSPVPCLSPSVTHRWQSGFLKTNQNSTGMLGEYGVEPQPRTYVTAISDETSGPSRSAAGSPQPSNSHVHKKRLSLCLERTQVLMPPLKLTSL